MSISFDNGIFRLETGHSSYIFRITEKGHPEHIYWGAPVSGDGLEAIMAKKPLNYGCSVNYTGADNYCLGELCLEWSGLGKGDYRSAPMELKMPDGTYVCDAVYKSHEIIPGTVGMEGLPSAYSESGDGAETLRLELFDAPSGLSIDLYYAVFPDCGVITRRTVIRNGGEGTVSIRKAMSFCLDMENRGFAVHSFGGGWIKEAHHTVHPLAPGMWVNQSLTGDSSNIRRPGFILADSFAAEDAGRVYAFDLVYSGNHYSSVELGSEELVRVQMGINPTCFDWTLAAGDSFESPEAVLAFSEGGFNGLREVLHPFVLRHIVRGQWRDKERPVLLNNWEAHFFKFTHGKLLRLARRAKKLGVELFVLDDGWFGARNSDNAGLGDYDTNLKKLPRGIEGLGRDIRRLGLDFGLWFEPEMVNPDSELYRAHPDWAVTVPGREPSVGRNQLVLDLTRAEVRDYIVKNVGECMDKAGVKYVKWDYNRHISDAFSPALENQGEFFHRYILGLYEILGRIFGPRPHVLLESCSSGGNRFDLGMLCYSPQIWASDDTDPIERLDIQGGLSCFYPQSCWGSHVSESPHQQTLRHTPLSTRFNVAAFGCLGYELDLKWLSYAEKKEIREQIAFYKTHRRLFQFGQFSLRKGRREGTEFWQVKAENEMACGAFQRLAHAAPAGDIMSVCGLEPDTEYIIRSKKQNVYIKDLGGLVRHVMPIELKPDGFILRLANRFYALTDGGEEYTARGDMLEAGYYLPRQFVGSGYVPGLRLQGDFGSTLYTVSKKETNT